MLFYVNNFIFSRDSEKAREYWGRYINFDNSHIVGELVGFSVLAIVSLDWVTYCIWSLERASNKLTDDCTIINVWQISNFTFKTVYHVLHVCKVCYCRLIWSFLRPATSFLIAQIYIHLYAVFADLFVGQLKSVLQCQTCGYRSVTFDPFWDLSLPIPKVYQ